jgi:hypothetical protein
VERPAKTARVLLRMNPGTRQAPKEAAARHVQACQLLSIVLALSLSVAGCTASTPEVIKEVVTELGEAEREIIKIVEGTPSIEEVESATDEPTMTPPYEPMGYPEPPTLHPLCWDSLTVVPRELDEQSGGRVVLAGVIIPIDPFGILDPETADPGMLDDLVWHVPDPPLPESPADEYWELFQGGEQVGPIALAQFEPGEHYIQLEGPSGEVSNRVYALTVSEAHELVMENAHLLFDSPFMNEVGIALSDSDVHEQIDAQAEAQGVVLAENEYDFYVLWDDLLTALSNAAMYAEHMEASNGTGGVLAARLSVPPRDLKAELDKAIVTLGKLTVMIKKLTAVIDLSAEAVELLTTLGKQIVGLMQQDASFPALPKMRQLTALGTLGPGTTLSYMNENTLQTSAIVTRLEQGASITIQGVAAGTAIIIGEVEAGATLSIESVPEDTAVIVLRNKGIVSIEHRSTSDEGLVVLCSNERTLNIFNNEGYINTGSNSGEIKVTRNDGRILVGRNLKQGKLLVTETGRNDLNTEELQVQDNLGNIQIGQRTNGSLSDGNLDTVKITHNLPGGRIQIYRSEDDIYIGANSGTVEIGTLFGGIIPGCNNDGVHFWINTGHVRVENNNDFADVRFRQNTGTVDRTREKTCP